MKNYGIIIIVLFCLLATGGVTYKLFFQPTTRTIVSDGGKIENVYNETPKVPIGGCSIYRLNLKLYWEKNNTNNNLIK